MSSQYIQFNFGSLLHQQFHKLSRALVENKLKCLTDRENQVSKGKLSRPTSSKLYHLQFGSGSNGRPLRQCWLSSRID